MNNDPTSRHSESITLQHLCELVDGEVKGDPSTIVNGVCSLDEPKEGALAFSRNPDPKRILKEGKDVALAGILVERTVTFGEQWPHCPVLFVADVMQAISVIMRLFHKPVVPEPGVSERAELHPSVKVGKRVSIAAFAVIGKGVTLGDDVVIHPHAVIYPGVTIGSRVTVHSQAVIREHCRLADDIVIQNGAVIGAEGFGYYYTPERGIQSVPQVGIVELQNGVEVGANSCIDRATIGATSVGVQTKLDNLVQVGHNVTIGAQSLVCALVGIAGSCRIGNGVTLGGNVGVADHVAIADGCRVAAKSGVTRSLQTKGDYAGFPPVPIGAWRRQMAALARLPQFIRSLKGKNSDKSTEED